MIRSWSPQVGLRPTCYGCLYLRQRGSAYLCTLVSPFHALADTEARPFALRVPRPLWWNCYAPRRARSGGWVEFG